MSNAAEKNVTKGRIAKRLILAMVLFSSLITAVTTAFQLFYDYRRGVSNIERSFFLVESSYLDGLTNSMWSFDDAQIKILMAGMAKLPDMEFITIKVDGTTNGRSANGYRKMSCHPNFPCRSAIGANCGPLAN